MIQTEPIVLLGPAVIVKTVAFLALAVVFYFTLKYGEIFYRKHLTKRRLFDRLFKWSQPMRNETLNLPANKLTVTKTEALQKARQAAITIGVEKHFISADDVYFQLEKEGIPIAALGAAAGSIFRTKAFAPTVVYQKSKRPSNRGRMIRIHQYVGTN